jgi:uncharacterized membrane protein
MTPRATKWLIGATIASVAVNLFLATWLVAWGWRVGIHLFGKPVFGPPPISERASGGDGLPPSLRALIDVDKTRLRPLMRDARDARRAVGDALQAEPFDAGQLDGALANLRRSADSIQLELHQAMLKAAIEGGPETRRAMAHPRGDRPGDKEGGRNHHLDDRPDGPPDEDDEGRRPPPPRP